MRAARYCGPHDFRLVEIDRPVPERGEVLLRVRAAGLCHSDLHIIFDELGGYPIPAPLTLGHEICGEAVELGEGVTGIELGRRYAVFGPVGCGNCRWCRSGRDNLCTESRWIGIARDGGYAEYVTVPAQALVPVPDSVSDAAAAIATDAILTSYHALLTVARLQPGEGVAIIGVGGLGLHAVQIASAFGAVVLALDIQERKLELARQHGAAIALDSRQLDPQNPPWIDPSRWSPTSSAPIRPSCSPSNSSPAADASSSSAWAASVVHSSGFAMFPTRSLSSARFGVPGRNSRLFSTSSPAASSGPAWKRTRSTKSSPGSNGCARVRSKAAWPWCPEQRCPVGQKRIVRPTTIGRRQPDRPMHALTAESFTGAAPRTRRRAHRQRAQVRCSLCLPRYRYPGAFAR